MRTVRWLACLWALGCGDPPPAAPSEPDASVVPTIEATAPAPAAVVDAPDVVVELPPAGDLGPTVQIASQPLRLGSPPGTFGRDASAEADQHEVTLPAFEMDRYLYPGEGQTPRTNVSRAEAAQLCEAEDKRLCTEMEWELACGGPTDTEYAGGESFLGTASAFGLEQMGTMGEWTSSPATRGLAEGTLDAAVFRGAAPDTETPEETMPLRRCASRRGTSAATRSRHIGFRCCRGESISLEYPSEPTRSRFRSRQIVEGDLRSMLGGVPEVARFADEFVLNRTEDATRAVGDPADLRGWELVDGALVWAPVAGEEIWVFSGRSGAHGLLVALHVSADGSFRHAASAILDSEPTPIALAFTPPERDWIQWSSDWGHTGEGGVITYRNGQVHIETR